MSRRNFFGIIGRASVRVVGSSPERFINLALAAGVRLWDTEINGNELLFSTDLSSIKTLAEIQDKTGYNLEVHRESGPLVIIRLFWRRKILLVGFFCFWFILYYLAGLVWSLRVEGLALLDQNEVLGYVESRGLEKWASWRRLNLDAIENELYVQYPEIAWVAVERSGTHILIRIVEKEPDPLHLGEPIDIVAAYDGIISEMMVIQGQARVEPGMTVAKGDVLISGVRSGDTLVNAAGYIKAIIHVEGYGEAALEEVSKEFTGRIALINVLQLGDKSIFLNSRKHGFANYEIEESRRYLRGNSRLPVVLVQRRYREIELITKVYTPEEADELARSRAMRLAHQQVGEHADLLKTEIRNIGIDAIFRYKVTLTIETKIGRESQNIGGED